MRHADVFMNFSPGCDCEKFYILRILFLLVKVALHNLVF